MTPTSSRSWEYGLRLAAILNQTPTATVSSHAYTYDAFNRLTRALLEDGSVWVYAYNDRDELTGARRYWPDWSPVAGQQYGYDYDNIGNRKTASSGGDVNGWNLRTASYAVNPLNQYTTIVTPGYEDICGVALATNNVTVNSATADRKREYFHREITIANTTTGVWQTVTVDSAGTTNKGGLAFPKNSQALTYDLDGNLTFDGIWNYEWDGENRLKSMSMTNLSGLMSTNRLKLDFAYDYQGRRLQKIVSTNSTGNTFVTKSTTRFVYDDWNLLATVNSQFTTLQAFLWGQDLSGTLDGAGGIGGLLGVSEYSGGEIANCHFASYDGNGNLTGLVSAGDKSISARYEYSPFGEILRATGPLLKVNPFRFSTKFADDESGCISYPRRAYSPNFGRWINRDPINEDGGNNLYAFAGNTPVNHFDPLGTYDEEEADLDKRLALASASGFFATYAYDDDLRATHQQQMQEGLETLERGGREIAIQVGLTLAGGAVAGIVGKGFGAVATSVERSAPKIARTIEDLSAGRVGYSGKRGFEMKVLGKPNVDTMIGGRNFWGHALDQLQARGIPPSVVLNTIKVGTKTAGNKPGRSVFIDAVNRVKVIVDDATGDVITAEFTP